MKEEKLRRKVKREIKEGLMNVEVKGKGWGMENMELMKWRIKRIEKDLFWRKRKDKKKGKEGLGKLEKIDLKKYMRGDF